MSLIALFGALLLSASGCGLRAGSDRIAFLRDGVLWTLHPDGSGPVNTAGNTVVSFAWSPNHHELVYRSGSSAMLTAHSRPELGTLGAPDAPSLINVASVNGGAAIQISPDQDASLRGDAWWDPSGHRLLYAEYYGTPAPVPAYVVSKADQPAGISRQRVSNAATLPVLSPDGYSIAIVDGQGVVRAGSPANPIQTLATGALFTLPQSVRPARILWQPKRQAVLYAKAAPSGVSLVLKDLNDAHETVVGTSALILDYAFSPDGSRLLVEAPDMLEVWDVTRPGPPLVTWPERDPYVLAWWAHDGKTILVQDETGWSLADIRSGSEMSLVSYATPVTSLPSGAIASWHPAAGSPWSADGSRFVFVSGPAQWRDGPLAAPVTGSVGLYVADPWSSTMKPRLIDSGADVDPSWSYADPSTTFLVAG